MLTRIEEEWLAKCKKNYDKYCIQVDNDAVFVIDLENYGECVFEFAEYGWQFTLSLLLEMGCNAEEV